MRISHWEALQPLCPRCLASKTEAHPLVLEEPIKWREDGVVLEGIVQCRAPTCGQEYPIIDGIPILVPNVREYVAAYAPMILQRSDLPIHIESLIGDCLGPEDQFNLTRYYLSSYAHDGYVREDDTDSVMGVLRACLSLMGAADKIRAGPSLDLGCSVGRTTLYLGENFDGLALGIDTNFSMLKIAQNALLEDRISFSRRKTGLVYEKASHNTDYAGRSRVDFWACDAQCLPFAGATISNVVALNLLDSVHTPAALLSEVTRVLEVGGCCGIATPFDWSQHVTPYENWIGGHSQRAPHTGSPVELLKSMLNQAGYRVLGERDEVAWSNTRSDRSTNVYDSYLVGLQKSNGDTNN